LGFHQIARFAGRARVRDDDFGEIHNVGLHKHVGVRHFVADLFHEGDQMGRATNHRIRQLDAFLFGVGGQHQFALFDGLHLVVTVPDVGG
jgi:hypothetical protein